MRTRDNKIKALQQREEELRLKLDQTSIFDEEPVGNLAVRVELDKVQQEISQLCDAHIPSHQDDKVTTTNTVIENKDVITEKLPWQEKPIIPTDAELEEMMGRCIMVMPNPLSAVGVEVVMFVPVPGIVNERFYTGGDCMNTHLETYRSFCTQSRGSGWFNIPEGIACSFFFEKRHDVIDEKDMKKIQEADKVMRCLLPILYRENYKYVCWSQRLRPDSRSKKSNTVSVVRYLEDGESSHRLVPKSLYTAQ